MSNARLRLAFARSEMAETMFPLEVLFFLESVGEPPGSPTPLPHPHRPETGR